MEAESLRGEIVFGAAFILAWLVGFGAWAFGIMETWAVQSLTGRFFSKGPVLRRLTTTRFPTFDSPDSRAVLSTVQLRLLRPDLIVFGPLARVFATKRPSFALKGQVQWRDGQVEVTIRAQLGVVLFMSAWIAGALIWTVAAVVFMPVHFLLMGVALSAAGTFLLVKSWLTAGVDADRVLSEVESFLAGHPPESGGRLAMGTQG